MIYCHKLVFIQVDDGPTLSGKWKAPAPVADGPENGEQEAEDLSKESSAPCTFWKQEVHMITTEPGAGLTFESNFNVIWFWVVES